MSDFDIAVGACEQAHDQYVRLHDEANLLQGMISERQCGQAFATSTQGRSGEQLQLEGEFRRQKGHTGTHGDGADPVDGDSGEWHALLQRGSAAKVAAAEANSEWFQAHSRLDLLSCNAIAISGDDMRTCAKELAHRGEHDWASGEGAL